MVIGDPLLNGFPVITHLSASAFGRCDVEVCRLTLHGHNGGNGQQARNESQLYDRGSGLMTR